MSTIDEIRVFIEQLRRPTPWPEELMLDSDLLRELHETWKKNELLSTLYIDRFEDALQEIYDAGAEDTAAIDVLDRMVAIVRRTEAPAELRLLQIADLADGLRPKRRLA